MSEHEQQPSNDSAQERKCRLRRRTRVGIAAFLLVGLGAIVGAAVAGAVGASAFGGFGHHMGHHGAHHSMESVEEHLQRKTTWVLRALDATPQQEQQVETVLSDTLTEVYPLVERHRENRALWLDELNKPELDRGALETLRGQELMLMDSMSVSLVDALGSVAEILTPEQRRELIDGIMSHHH